MKSQISNSLTNTVNPIPLNVCLPYIHIDNYWYEDIKPTYTDENIQRIFLKVPD